MLTLPRLTLSRGIFLAVALVTTATILAPQPAQAEIDEQITALWEDFNHYVRIARYDLAQAAAESLLSRSDDQQLLQAVQEGDYADWQSKTMPIASRVASLKEAAAQLGKKIFTARISQSRDADRIDSDIQLLAGTLRQRTHAIGRLREAGQFAASHLLMVLLDDQFDTIRPHVISAMSEIGRPLVTPLSEAMLYLEPVQAGQVARILAQIGYPRALPYLSRVLENPKTDEKTKLIVQTAYDRLAQKTQVADDVSAAELFLTLGENYYQAGSKGEILPGYDGAGGQGIVWSYNRQSGLVAVPVPQAIFADVLAMRAAGQALALDPQLDPALSLWLAANLRRENRLPAGQTDGVTRQQRSPAYYARMAGPMRLHDVLTYALDDGDADLTLDAIQALQDTCGTSALLGNPRSAQPLVRALTYPDRRVRFPAAFVLAQTHPTSQYPSSHQIVPVLSEALRQTDTRHALVIGQSQETLNLLIDLLKTAGYQVSSGISVNETIDAINISPGVDLIVVLGSSKAVQTTYHDAAGLYKLAAAPILALVSSQDQAQLDIAFKHDTKLRTALQGGTSEQLASAIDQLMTQTAGQPLNSDQAAAYAQTALTLLRDIALTGNSIYDVHEALPALLLAMDDSRDDIVAQGARVLELMDDQSAQLTIADHALNPDLSLDLRIALLNSLAQSTKQWGNKLGQIQLDEILELAKTSSGELALAAARVHGALTLPTGNVVELITQ